MFKSKWLLAAVIVGVGFAGFAFGQAEGPANPQPGANPGAGGPNLIANLLQRFNGLAQYVAVLAEANLSPDFTLTAEQKTQIKEIRGQFQKDAEEFIKKNQEQIDKIRQSVQAARDAGDPDAMREAFRQAMQDGQELASQGPKPQEYVAKIKAVLTPEQADQVDKKLKEMQQQMRQMQGMGPGRAPGAGPGGPGGGAPAPAPDAPGGGGN
jgi:Spy/CpxP family protein refolding chaperone